MNSSVLIETERIVDALLLPIQCVYGYRGKTFCLVKNGSDWKTVEVKIGSNNDTNVVVEDSINEGDQVALNPAAFKDLMDLPDIPEVDDKDKSKGKRGAGSKEKSKSDYKKKSAGKGSGKSKGGQSKGKKKESKGNFSKGNDSDSKNSPGKSTPNPNQSGKKGSRESGPNSETAKKPTKADGKKA